MGVAIQRSANHVTVSTNAPPCPTNYYYYCC